MTAHGCHLGVIMHGFGALQSLAYNDANRAPIASAGAIPVILRPCKPSVGNPGVILQGCCALSSNAIRDANKSTIAAAGAVPVILKAMTVDAGHTGVNAIGLRALENLAKDHNANNVTIVVAGAKRTHDGHLDVTCRGLSVLQCLAVNVTK